MASADMSKCVDLAVEASNLENNAMELDRANKSTEAAAEYRKASAKLLEATKSCPPDHADVPVLTKHAEEVAARATYLEGLNGAAPTTPLEDTIHSVHLTMEVAENPTEEKKGTKKNVMAAAAVIGGVAGLICIGPLAALAVAGGAAYATTRDDVVGEKARMVGSKGVEAVKTAKESVKTFDDENKVTETIKEKSKEARASITAKASELDEEYKIREKAALAASKTQEALTEFDEKHDVSGTVKKTVEKVQEKVEKVGAKVVDKVQGGRDSCF
eukprot:gnl/TRDRNA2_/TRDRNA2_186054_c0_seq1.p2 gnl/TRDRNA2_/TRDRNA2_186054_c0~~gnl/TRDRNA2_/TRDRNA2_186054_c0_seq1.p2  ORF type:complete len:273 (+),score=106.68 gnl/TRDRNA2_/TRDRNA2_186054_c0_seq1:88-906(+)